MNKFDKLRLALILMDIDALRTGDPSKQIASTAGALMANVDEDGFDKQDIAKLMLDQSFDRDKQGLVQKIQNNLSLHKDKIMDALSKDQNNLAAFTSGTLGGVYQAISSLLSKKRKMQEGGSLEDEENVAIVRVGKKTYRAIVAESEEEKEVGLSNCEELESDEAMLFVYEEPQHLDFWMKDCDLTLSIIFIDENKTVISNQKGLPNTEDFISADNAKYVLEVNYTEEIQPGDKVIFNLGEELEMEPDKLYVLAEDGGIQGVLDPGVRIFSRKSTSVMIKKAKKADESKSDVDYKDLGRYVFGELDRQEKRDPEYVDEGGSKKSEKDE